jgi:sarcosine oxidase subunit gamma
MTRRTIAVMVEAVPVGPFDRYREAFAALEGRTGRKVTLEVEAPATHVVVRVAPAGDVLGRVSQAAGVSLPLDPNHVAFAPEPDAAARRALWLGPDEWLLVGPLDHRGALLERLAEARRADHVSVIDLSAARSAVQVRGPAARDLLAPGCGLDLDPRVFPRGRCAQTALARAPVLLEPTGEGDTFRITCRPSLAGYLADWLLDAAEEFVAP